jgi:hypothetical protein
MERVEINSLEVIEKANKYPMIKTVEENERAVEFAKFIKIAQKDVEISFNPIVDKAHQAHKEAIGQRDKYLKPLLHAEVLVKNRIKEFLTEQERQRRERELKIQREAEEKAEKERQKLLEQAKKAEKMGDDWKANDLREQAEYVSPVINIQENNIKTEGMVKKTTWKALVTDINLVPREYMVINQTALDGLARATKGTLQLPGVKFVEEINVGIK